MKRQTARYLLVPTGRLLRVATTAVVAAATTAVPSTDKQVHALKARRRVALF